MKENWWNMYPLYSDSTRIFQGQTQSDDVDWKAVNSPLRKFLGQEKGQITKNILSLTIGTVVLGTMLIKEIPLALLSSILILRCVLHRNDLQQPLIPCQISGFWY